MSHVQKNAKLVLCPCLTDFVLSRGDNGRTTNGMHVTINNAHIQKKTHEQKTKQSGAREYKALMTTVMNANDNNVRGSSHPLIAGVMGRKALSCLLLNKKNNERVKTY